MGRPTRMKPTLQGSMVLAMTGAAAAGAFAQAPPLPVGNWQSPVSATYTNPALTGAELYLDIDVARDGSFRGVWGQYLCTSYPGAYGVSIHSCSRSGSNPVSGRFGPGRQGVIDLERLGGSTFGWDEPATDELAIDLPRNWQGSDAVLYRARRDAEHGVESPRRARHFLRPAGYDRSVTCGECNHM